MSLIFEGMKYIVDRKAMIKVGEVGQHKQLSESEITGKRELTFKTKRNYQKAKSQISNNNCP